MKERERRRIRKKDAQRKRVNMMFVREGDNDLMCIPRYLVCV